MSFSLKQMKDNKNPIFVLTYIDLHINLIYDRSVFFKLANKRRKLKNGKRGLL